MAARTVGCALARTGRVPQKYRTDNPPAGGYVSTVFLWSPNRAASALYLPYCAATVDVKLEAFDHTCRLMAVLVPQRRE